MASAREHFFTFSELGEALRREHGLDADFMHGVTAARMRNISLFAFRAMQHARRTRPSRNAGEIADEIAAAPASSAVGSWQVHALDWAMDPAGR